MKVIIVDDEPIAQEILLKFASKVSFLEIIGIYDNALSALEELNTVGPDLIFLDVQMPEMSGVELAKILEKDRAQIIFTTAYPEFALDGFELEVTDYLLKPIPFDRFMKAINKAHQNYLNYNMVVKMELTKQSYESIWVKEGKKIVQIYLDDIILVKAMADYMEFKMVDSRVIVHITMIKLEELLPSPTFLRVNRSCIVKLAAIRSIQDLQIETVLQSEPRISIGPTYWDNIKRYLNELF